MLLTDLYEGIKPSMKSLSELDKVIKTFKIGIEFEFYIEEEALEDYIDFGDDDMLFSPLKKMLRQELSTSRNIKDVVPDSSLDDYGVEVITHPLSFNTAMKTMKDVLGFIRRYGWTNSTTGMHVNISHQSFESGGEINPLQLIVLLGGDYFQRGQKKVGDKKEEIIKYPERFSETDSMLGKLDNEMVMNSLADEYNAGGFQRMEAFLLKILPTNVRQSSINFKHLFGNLKQAERRIEYRFFGGDDYELRASEMENDIRMILLTMAHVLSGVFDKNSYKKDLLRILNGYSKGINGKDFLDYAKNRKGEYSKKDDVNRKINKKSQNTV